MNVSVLIATHGDHQWAELAARRAYPSAAALEPYELASLHVPDGTLAQVRNELALAASGEWLCFLDADDELDPGYLDAMQQINCLSPRGCLLVPAVSYVRDDGTRTDPAIPSWGRDLADLNCAVIGTLVPRALFHEVGGFRDLPMYEDWDLWTRAVLAGAHLVPAWDAIYLAHVRPMSRNNQDPSVSEAVYADLRALYAPQWAQHHALARG